jgi:hypothetical protein
VIPVDGDSESWTTTIGLNIGFQGLQKFQVNPLGQYLQTFDLNCDMQLSGRMWGTSCSEGPVLADPYFNSTMYAGEALTGITYAGYRSSGMQYNSTVCVGVEDVDYFCLNDQHEFYSIEAVLSDNWNYWSNASAGVFGMGRGSAIWEIIGSPETIKFDIYLTNYVDWSFTSPDYEPYTKTSVINLQ